MVDHKQQLIQATYTATVEPEQLETFEMLWESYIDNELINNERADLKANEINKHISLALDILSRVNHVRDASAEAQKIVDSEYGVRFLFDKDGKIIASNSDAKSFLKNIANIYDLDIDPKAIKKIKTWLANLDNPNANKFLFVHVMWENTGLKNCFFLTPIQFRQAQSEPSSTSYLVTLVDFDVVPDALPSIQEAYQLTQAEADVAMRLANGRTPKEISIDRNVSIFTVRTQIQMVLKKTESRTIPEMVKTLTGMSVKYSTLKSQKDMITARQTQNESLLRPAGLTLNDGRYFQYFEQGHPNGLPVILFPFPMYDVGLSQASAKMAVLRGLRVITPLRAGYGDSDPNPKNSAYELVDSSAADLRNLIEHLGLSKLVLMCGWAGYHAQHFAVKHPNLVHGILQLGTIPIWNNAYIKTLRSRQRNVMKTSIHAPQVVPYLARVGKALMNTGRGTLFATSLDKDRPIDLEALEDPDNLETIMRGYEVIGKQGVRTIAKDLHAIHADWKYDAEKLTVPITVLVGSKNTDFPETAFLDYQKIVPQTVIKSIEGAGSYLHLTHFDIVSKELQSLSAKKITSK